MCAGIDQSKLTIPFFKQFSHLGLINPSFLLWSLYWTQTSKRLVKYFQIEFIKHKGIVLALGMEFKVVASKLNWNFCKWTTQVHIIPMQTTVGLYNSWQSQTLAVPLSSRPGGSSWQPVLPHLLPTAAAGKRATKTAFLHLSQPSTGKKAVTVPVGGSSRTGRGLRFTW